MTDIRLKKITVQSNQSPLIIQKGDVVISNTTISNRIFQGSLIVNGGVSVNTTYNATSSTAGGSLTIGGGLGVIKNVYIGNDLVLDSTNSIFKINGLSNDRLLLDGNSFSLSPDGVNKRFYLTDASLSVNLTTGSLNSSTGALCVAGGVSVNSVERANSSSNGGALTVAGGIAVGENINVNKDVILGEYNSNNSGLTIRYTGQDQFLLMDSTESGYSSLNMVNNNLFVSNDANINIHTSNWLIFQPPVNEENSFNIRTYTYPNCKPCSARDVSQQNTWRIPKCVFYWTKNEWMCRKVIKSEIIIDHLKKYF